MPTCMFCNKNYPEHKGLTVFTLDGKSLRYCSSKCRRNFELKRDPKKIKWIKKKKKEVKKEEKNSEKTKADK